MSTISRSAYGGVSGVSSSGGVTETLDIETAIMAAQQSRAELIESQLTQQISAVQRRNDEMRKLSELQAEIARRESLFDATDSKSRISEQKYFKETGAADKVEFERAFVDTDPDRLDVGASGKYGTVYADLAEFAQMLKDAGFDDATVNKFAKGDATLADFKALETSVKGKIDSTASTQQMDMLRMQSLNNKRNEAYDIMTNWLKNIQDKKSTIIGNMR